jgi:hypothetical protein
MARVQGVLQALAPSNLATCWAALRRDLDLYSGAGRKPKLQQLREIVSLSLRGDFYPEEYFRYRFYEQGKDYPYMLQFLPERQFKGKIWGVWNDSRWKSLLDNKWMFHLYYKSLGLQVTDVLGYYNPDDGCAITGQPLRSKEDVERLLWEHRPRSLVIKPVGGIQGNGILIVKSLHYENDVVGTRIDGKPVLFSDVIEHLEGSVNGQLRFDGYLLEERVDDHPFFAEINPYTASTIRVVTYANARGEIEIDFTTVRLGRMDRQVENYSQGGISVGIDRDTGELGLGQTKARFGAVQQCSVHPDSNVRFTGRAVPMWRQVTDLCKRAAMVTPGLRSIGWDVILTPAGPRLIEGNWDWALAVQMHTTGYLTPQVRARLAEHGLTFPTERLPGLQFGGFGALLRYR